MSHHFTLTKWKWAKWSRENPRWQKNCNKIRMMFFTSYCIFANTNVPRTLAPCPPHGYREGQTTLTLHWIVRSTAPQFAGWSKIEIKNRGVYRFTLAHPDRTRLYSNWARLAPAYGHDECICIRTCMLRLSGLYCRRRGYHFTIFSILDRETRHLK